MTLRLALRGWALGYQIPPANTKTGILARIRGTKSEIKLKKNAPIKEIRLKSSVFIVEGEKNEAFD
jgi:hypothetical protein